MYNTTPPGSSSLTWIAHKKKMILVKVAPHPRLSLQRISLWGGLLPVSVREIPFPTPAYTQDPFATFVKSVFGLFFVPLANTRDIFLVGYVGVGQRGLHCLMPFRFSTFLNSIPWQLTPKSTSKTHPNTKGNDLPKLFHQPKSSHHRIIQVLVFIWPLTRIMKSLVEDKEARINEVMKMMGMPAAPWFFQIAWILPG